ncbi:MAG: hypothetical protein ACK5PI_02755, partial [Acetobacteraceae bacterium]
ARVIPISGHAAAPGGIWSEGTLLRDDAGTIADLSACPALPGAHNAQNAAAATAAALSRGVSRDAIAPALASFRGLPHRQSLVATACGVRFVDDSKATNADAAARAMGCYERFVWIAGGMRRALPRHSPPRASRMTWRARSMPPCRWPSLQPGPPVRPSCCSRPLPHPSTSSAGSRRAAAALPSWPARFPEKTHERGAAAAGDDA